MVRPGGLAWTQSDIVDEGSVVLDDLGDTAHDVVDTMAGSVP